MPVLPGLPSPRVEPYLTHAASRERYAGRAEFEISRIHLVGNSGTYLDSPYHRFPDAPDVAALPLESLVGLPGTCLDGRAGPGGRAVGLDAPWDELGGHAVLVRTGWDRHFARDGYWTEGPFLSSETVERLVGARVALVGVDFVNVDDVTDPARPAHTALLDAGVLIVEQLVDLDRLPSAGFRFSAPVLAVRGAAGLPVRAFAELGDAGAI
jgi:kynurenine formamidase